ncbi:MAG: hypothetical protein A3G18_01275 [Rhodospirillales bacterium RIFCSPLOWO2_12_FULL_58_28]|nr:MAG: hypothetical protein A3H92_04475 [Rhodospirillales bacterium RIFCSPLOWO2_02_FULL_58_16]OHC78032.1 MAG: hypothetical protein A3G18_01275 [Rhodospirillales bacterium RIFCSPLOWO2_12_FULL_58_28]
MMRLLPLLALVPLLAGCGDDDASVQGYVEGEYLMIGLPAPGRVVSVAVERGAEVQPGQVLFSLDAVAEEAALAEARARLEQARHQRDDLLTGKRVEEISAIEARIAQAEAGLRLSAAQLKRQQNLVGSAASAEARLDESRAAVERDRSRVTELTAELALARRAARSSAVAAAEAAVDAARAAVAQFEWRLAERTARAPGAARVEDVLFRPGEETAAGRPVVSLLPRENVFLRFYLSPPLVARVAPGVRLAVACAGCADGLAATVSYVSPEAVFAPPVLYSREAKDKLVFLVEAKPQADAALLRPGQPVTLTLPKAATNP